MNANQPLTANQLATLAALANAIIPADETDGGAESVNSSARIAQNIQNGLYSKIYAEGIAIAETLAIKNFNRKVSELSLQQIHDLIAAVREAAPAFFNRLRMDVTAFYLAEPLVWQRIGFPGPSTDSGGYPDFDQPQSQSPRSQTLS
jgi:hypothetical protein